MIDRDCVRRIARYHAKRILSQLKIGYDISDRVAEVVAEHWNGFSISELTAVVVYVVAKNCGFKVRQTDIARIAGITEVTIRNIMRRLNIKPIPTKQKITNVLKHYGCLTSSEIAMILGMDVLTIKQYLCELRKSGVVDCRRIGNLSVWYLSASQRFTQSAERSMAKCR